MNEIILLIKILEGLLFLVALFYGIKNYRLTKSISTIWLYVSLAMFCAFALSVVRIVNEVWLVDEFEVIKIQLISLVIAFFLAAAITVRKERRLPHITPVSEPSGMTYCGIPHSNVYIGNLEKQKAAATAGKREKCPVRICVEERGIKNCLECSEYPDCDIRTKAMDECQLLRYKLKKGHIYLKKEESPEGGFELFVDLLMRGLHGLCITRTNPVMIREKYKLKKTPIVWLTEMQTSEELIISPQLERLLHMINDFIDKSNDSIILLDGLGYLIHHNNFERVLHFLHRLRDEVAVSNSRLIIPLSPLTLQERELKLLEREAEIIEI
ncbi:MAG: DUF835 domain-containing protein [Candidatus Altiarchaeota archaeon]|nr:DUF835 domain-containing protein [Candidatus Altiarchaeota archaeon]